MSDSFSISIHSGLLKSQFCFKCIFTTSLKSILKSLFKSNHFVISNL